MTGVVGVNSISGYSVNGEDNGQAHKLVMWAGTTYTATTGDQVDTFGFFCENQVGDGAGVGVALYDITAGDTVGTLVASGTKTTITANANNTISITPVALTNAHIYAVAFRIISATDVGVYRLNQGDTAAHTSTKTGTTAFDASWSNSSDSFYTYAFYANISAAASGATIPQLDAMNRGMNRGMH